MFSQSVEYCNAMWCYAMKHWLYGDKVHHITPQCDVAQGHEALALWRQSALHRHKTTKLINHF